MDKKVRRLHVVDDKIPLFRGFQPRDHEFFYGGNINERH